MLPVTKAQCRMHVHTVEEDQRRQPGRETDTESANRPRPMFVASIGHARVGCDGKGNPFLQVLADGQIEGLSAGGPDAIGAGSEDDCRTAPLFCQHTPIEQWPDIIGTRIILYSYL